MAEKRMYHTMRARWETSKDLIQKGKTAEAADQNQLTIAEALIEILATLEEISDVLQIIAGVNKAPASSPKPAAKEK